MRILLMKEIDGRNTRGFLFVFSRTNVVARIMIYVRVSFFVAEKDIHRSILTVCFFFIAHHLWMRKQFFPHFHIRVFPKIGVPPNHPF